MTKKGGQVGDKWFKAMLKKIPLNRRGLQLVHELYEKNWWHLTRTYRGKQGKKFQRREVWLNAKELKIRANIGLLFEIDDDFNDDGYDKFLLNKLVECYFTRSNYRNNLVKNDKNNLEHPLTKVDSCDILSKFEGDVE